MLRAHIEAPSLTKPNGSSAAQVLQEVLHLPRKRTLWERLFTWEKLLVAGREVKGLVVTPTMGLTVFLALAGVIGAMHYRTADAIQVQSGEMRELRDMVIRMETRLDERTTHQKEAESKREREQKDSEEIAKVWRETMTHRMNRIDGGK